MTSRDTSSATSHSNDAASCQCWALGLTSGKVIVHSASMSFRQWRTCESTNMLAESAHAEGPQIHLAEEQTGVSY